ncbi:U1 small nuclear ribonucleoprotein [Wickerhamomyces ciferrii]|uniref:U1 small nuclear ribonucleoprotein component SNU71 n=1 Tax=Wickerhamomyces ciferrii (strain ATCC 14091 / BCRC 22168 / CBS 111 / JCM 3599 / NBRC 0793 / NRRL Y-1031 F-60-10) TaxID=1206466 RepID=K0KGD1_WICCF|nr:U1 small nuclear ribonucleoprotein [Wickerhamomyces ciferrii]CCH42021.1 U1 small nuclear ribonucleoprotein [Wickerhamomyces ciferrii]
MSKITTFTSYQSPSESIDSILPDLSQFKGLDQSNAIKQSKIGAIPIYKNQLHLINNNKQNLKAFKETDENNEVDQMSVTKEQYELSKFLELKSFKPQGLKDQLMEIVIKGVKILNNLIIEQVLNYLTTGEYVWSCIDGNNQDKIIFIRFINEDGLVNLSQIKKFLGLNGFKYDDSQWEICIEDNTENLINDSQITVDKLDQEGLRNKINELLEGSKLEKPIDHGLDYKIDEMELIDLPQDVLPQLYKDIKEFRLKVLENERKKRAKESLEELKRSKGQLRKLFEKFQNEESEIVEDDDDSSDEDDLNDEDYEKEQINLQKEEMLKNYNNKLKVVEHEESYNQELIEKFNDLNNYERSLNKDINGMELGQFKPSNRDKIMEEDMDSKDREEEKHQLEIKSQSMNFLESININIPLKQKEQVTIDDLDESQLEQVLTRLKPIINQIIQEFLGTQEDELLEYILEIIKDTKSKVELIKELNETFDEDSIKIGDKIWLNLEEQITLL